MERFIIVLAVVFSLGACSGNPLAFLYKNGNGTFTHAPIDLNVITGIMPLGHLAPPAHTIPANHIYFCYAGHPAAPVYAPGTGIIDSIDNYSGQDYKVSVKFTATSEYYLDHVIVNANIRTGDSVRAGEQIGTTSPYSSCVDFGLINIFQPAKAFANPKRYNSESLYADSPLKYFETQSRLLPLVQRSGSDKYGKICYDVPDRLMGNWFWAELPIDQKIDGPDYLADALAFVHPSWNPDVYVISIGTLMGTNFNGVWEVQSNAVKFEDVSVDTGNIEYELYTSSEWSSSNYQVGLLLAEMTATDEIKVELFTNGSLSALSNYSFSSNAFYFKR